VGTLVLQHHPEPVDVRDGYGVASRPAHTDQYAARSLLRLSLKERRLAAHEEGYGGDNLLGYPDIIKE
jgi:hypothetical protein